MSPETGRAAIFWEVTSHLPGLVTHLAVNLHTPHFCLCFIFSNNCHWREGGKKLGRSLSSIPTQVPSKFSADSQLPVSFWKAARNKQESLVIESTEPSTPLYRDDDDYSESSTKPGAILIKGKATDSSWFEEGREPGDYSSSRSNSCKSPGH